MKLVIVGGVAGGASAATRARRLSETAEITLIERGEHISFANCGLPYHIGGVIKERAKLLVQTPAGMKQRYMIDIRVNSEVTAIDRAKKEVSVVELPTKLSYTIAYDKLILSPGAAPIKSPIPGSESQRVMTLRNMADMDRIIAAATEAICKNTLLIGGGYIGLEIAEALKERGMSVTLVVQSDHVMMAAADPEMTAPIHQELKLHGVDLRLETSVTSIFDDGAQLQVVLSNGEKMTFGLAIIAKGVKPEVKLARDAGLKIGERGGIVVDAHMQTSDPDIYAVGDAVEVSDFVSGRAALIPLAGPANRQGRIAADNIFGRNSTYRSTQGTAICKVFNLAIGMTGMSEKALKRAGMAYEKVYVHPAAHASYYPGASPISLKLLFNPSDGKILGVQAVGAHGVDKRIDVLATAMRAGMTVFDLQDLELSYAPPYGSAKDVVNYAGYVAANAIKGDVTLCHTEDMIDPKPGQILLDVREKAEVESGTIPDSVHIPLGQLRNRLGELSRKDEILVFCQVGLRGYLACRILMQNGYKCRNLTGGYKTYMMCAGFVQTCARCPRPEDEVVNDDAGAAATNGCQKKI